MSGSPPNVSLDRGAVAEHLARVPLFARLSRRQLHRLARLCIPRGYPAGESIVEEGATGLGLFVVMRGEVEVFKGSGDDRLVLDILGPGSILGEMALIDELPRSASAVSREPTDCLLITRDGFRTLSEKDPEIAWCLVPALVERLRDLQQRLQEAEEEADAETPAAAATAPASTKDATAGDKPRGDKPRGDKPRGDKPRGDKPPDSLGPRALRAQLALLVAGGTTMSGAIAAATRFLTELAHEVTPASARDLPEVGRRLPAGLANAARSSFVEGAKLPGRVAAAFERVWSEESDE